MALLEGLGRGEFDDDEESESSLSEFSRSDMETTKGLGMGLASTLVTPSLEALRSISSNGPSRDLQLRTWSHVMLWGQQAVYHDAPVGFLHTKFDDDPQGHKNSAYNIARESCGVLRVQAAHREGGLC